ncbi:MAG: YigZ family protein [Bacteroidota bacterium]
MTAADDTYFSLEHTGASVYREKASKFIGLAYPVSADAEIRETLAVIRKKFYDANHHCFAYCLGPQQQVFRFSDDGEPSGSAGRPIHGQLLSKNLSDALVIVVRYFGGTKLGVPGLIHAYRQTASDALENAGRTQKIVTRKILVTFRYENMNDVMRIQKDEDLILLEQNFDNECRITLGVRKSKVEMVINKLMRIQNIYTSIAT